MSEIERSAWRRWWSAWTGTAQAGQAVVHRRWSTTELRFAEGTAQSRMSMWAPDRLVVDYTRTMLGSLVLVPAPERIGMVGLGGGSQAKFLHRHLRTAYVEVMEVSDEVIGLRRRFRIPDDDDRLCVVQADAAVMLRERVAAYDLLLVDGYDESGIPEVLSTQRFYNDCRASLRPGGAMAVNLYDTEQAAHLHRLKIAFGQANVALVEEPRQSNRVAFGWVPPLAPASNPLTLSAAGQAELVDVLNRMRQRSLGRG